MLIKNMVTVFYRGLMVAYIPVHFMLINDMVLVLFKHQIYQNLKLDFCLFYILITKREILMCFFLKGLYRLDERFGPGILIYKSIQSADVGFWVDDDLVRLLYPHPTLNLDIHITDKKSPLDSSLLIPSWYAPEELLSTIIDLDFILKKKSNALFCKNIQNESSPLTHYLYDHSNRLQEAMHDKCAQLDAYLTCLNNEVMLKEKNFNERIVEISPPNETYEQQQLYYYINKFWPLKQEATFPIEEILSSLIKYKISFRL